ncbi:MAG: hypothetical protein RJQ01_07950 [Microcella sp.]|uniref:YqaJ viral recombinase family protein n=1 Tax=Microcella sp. TaxID=1913979 RepID=UPI0033153772
MKTETLPPLVSVTEDEATEQEWLDARAGRVTASEVHSIAVGGRSTWLRILESKLNGSKFFGTASTRRGKHREAFLIDYISQFIDPTMEPNGRLFVRAENGRHGATPDGIGATAGAEVKSLDFGANQSEPPEGHYDQCQFGMYVTGRPRWLYLWEVMGEDGEPTLDDPQYVWIERDERRIERLVSEADKFLEWWDAGAPETDDLDPELDDALALFADARSRKNDAAADEKAAEQRIRVHIAATEGAEENGLKLAGRAAQLVYTVSEKQALDAEAWAEAEPESFAGHADLLERAADATKAATAIYHKTVRSTRLAITPTKEKKA